MHRHLAAACAVLLMASQPAAAQQYYNVPIEDGGVAFLLDVSGSMDNKGEQIREAAATMLRDLAVIFKDTAVGKTKIAQDLRARPVTTAVPKMGAARTELMHALDSLREGTSFTIITFGERASEWPGGVRRAGSSAKTLAREYVATLEAAGGTPMAEALRLGFESSDVRTLFVVSDGRPTTAPVLELVRRMQESREGRRMIINTVGIGSDQDGALLCQLALDNEGVYVRDGEIACTFSPCSAGDGVVTFYPPSATRKRPAATAICSAAEHPDCTPDLVYETMLSEARFQTRTADRSAVTNCLELDRPGAQTIVINPEGREATNYTRPGNPLHPSRVTRIVKQQGKDVVVETTGAGKGGWDLDVVDKALSEAVGRKLKPVEVAKPVEVVKPVDAPKPKDAPLSLPSDKPPPP